MKSSRTSRAYSNYGYQNIYHIISYLVRFHDHNTKCNNKYLAKLAGILTSKPEIAMTFGIDIFFSDEL